MHLRSRHPKEPARQDTPGPAWRGGRRIRAVALLFLRFVTVRQPHRPTPTPTDWSEEHHTIYRLLCRIELACHDPTYDIDEQLPFAYRYAKLHAVRSIGFAGFQQLQAWCRSMYPPMPIDAWEQLIPDNLRLDTDVVLAHRQWLRMRILHLDLSIHQLLEIETGCGQQIEPMPASLRDADPTCEPSFRRSQVVGLIWISVAALGTIEAAIDRMAHPRTW